MYGFVRKLCCGVAEKTDLAVISALKCFGLWYQRCIVLPLCYWSLLYLPLTLTEFLIQVSSAVDTM